jgi:hypothetical protein
MRLAVVVMGVLLIAVLAVVQFIPVGAVVGLALVI